MTAEQFAYWLQGFAEHNSEPPSPEVWASIRAHLQTVFVKVTPAFVPQFPAPIIGQPGYLRTLDLRPSDLIHQLGQRFPLNPAITC